VLQIFIALKNLSSLVEFEPANLGSNDKYDTEDDKMGVKISWYKSDMYITYIYV
jgi:hypothetical protein